MISAIEDARCVEAQLMSGAETDIFIHEQGRALPFPVRRVFTVHARGAAERGRHAHKQCGQVMVCLAGHCDITVDDGKDRKTVQLTRPQDALYVPPSIWAEQSYRAPETILMVLCDQLYDEADYIRDYDVFRTWRAECEERGAPA